MEFAYSPTCLNRFLLVWLHITLFFIVSLHCIPLLLLLLIKHKLSFSLLRWCWSGWRLMELYKLYQNFSEITKAEWFIITETLYLWQNVQTYGREKENKKTSNFQYPRVSRPGAFTQAFQPSVNYSGRQRRTRSLSAITLHSSLSSVSNINVMAFIFLSRLWRGKHLSRLLSLSHLSVNMWHFKKTKETNCALVTSAWSGHLKATVWKTCEDKRLIVSLLSQRHEAEVLYYLWYLNWRPTSVLSEMTHCLWVFSSSFFFSTHLIPWGKVWTDRR